MPYELATPAIQAALITLMAADATLTAQLQTKPTARGGGPAIYDDGDVYDGQLFPYLTIGAWTQIPAHQFSPDGTGFGWNCTCQIQAFSQRVGVPSTVMSEVLRVLEHGTALEIEGYASAWVDEAAAQPMFKATMAGKTTYQQPVIIRVHVG